MNKFKIIFKILFSKVHTIELTPRFTGDYFDGYDQTGGSVICDVADKKYSMLWVK